MQLCTLCLITFLLFKKISPLSYYSICEIALFYDLAISRSWNVSTRGRFTVSHMQWINPGEGNAQTKAVTGRVCVWGVGVCVCTRIVFVQDGFLFETSQA